MSAETAYVFGYPLLLSDRAARDANRLFVGCERAHTRRIWGWLDLGTEPWVLSLPDTIGRYSVVCLRDAWHTAFASVGARTTGTGARAFAIVGPARQGIHLRTGLSPIAAPTRIVRVTGCLEATSAGDPDLAEGIRLAPLSRWHGGDDGFAPTPADGADHGAVAAIDEIERLDAWRYLSELVRISDDNPPERADRDMLTDVRALLEGARTEALEQGVQRGREAVRRAAAAPPGESVGCWRVDYDVGRYGKDYLRRAAVARVGLGAEPATDELPAVLDTDDDGRPLTGCERYLLRFPEHAIPPVSAFWSLSTAAGSVSDLRGLVLDADGSLSIRIQHGAPEDGPRANWLPAPAGSFAIALRLYWPREEVLERRWAPPPVTRVGR